MRFGRHRAPAEEQAWNDLLQLQPSQEQPAPLRMQGQLAGPAALEERELFVRHARKDGRLIAMLRAVDRGSTCVVEAEISPQGTNQLVTAGPYTFADAHQASAFVTEAVEALMYLGCDIQAV
ncbi:MAG: hypothetical protein ACM3QU_15620 [Verrucomicrobiota bacterium]